MVILRQIVTFLTSYFRWLCPIFQACKTLFTNKKHVTSRVLTSSIHREFDYYTNLRDLQIYHSLKISGLRLLGNWHATPLQSMPYEQTECAKKVESKTKRYCKTLCGLPCDYNIDSIYEVCKLSKETGSVVFDLATLRNEEWKKRLQRSVASEGSYFEGDNVELDIRFEVAVDGRRLTKEAAVSFS
ncbi:hypothetical protein TNCV_4057991 [Trichonephila clavipes]|nr:hypothetical protein TNCV_4057991 [Trichonephila clavipes]